MGDFEQHFENVNTKAFKVRLGNIFFAFFEILSEFYLFKHTITDTGSFLAQMKIILLKPSSFLIQTLRIFEILSKRG